VRAVERALDKAPPLTDDVRQRVAACFCVRST
jgi:hypothetical protein